MAQNTSTAVMQRRSEAHDSLDHYPTPPWATRAMLEWLQKEQAAPLSGMSAWEPACAEGYMARPMREYFSRVYATDIHDYAGNADKIADFLFPGTEPTETFDWIVTNPPFRLAEQFIYKALDLADIGVAVIVRSAFLEGKGRYEGLFAKVPPYAVLQFVERVPMVKGKVDEKAASATAYCWIVWLKRSPASRPLLDWLPPCRRALERAQDYTFTVAK
jgi:hypothetical protein